MNIIDMQDRAAIPFRPDSVEKGRQKAEKADDGEAEVTAAVELKRRKKQRRENSSGR